MVTDFLRRRLCAVGSSRRAQGLIIVLAIVALGGGLAVMSRPEGGSRLQDSLEVSSQAKRLRNLYMPTPAQWASLSLEPAQRRVLRTELATEGKIAVDEDRTTPIFSPYAGRVTTLLVKPGDVVAVGQPLFIVEATDMVVAQNDLIAGATALNKARAALNLAQIIDKRQRDLHAAKAVPLKEVQQARAALDAAQNDLRAAEVAYEAARNRLRIFGKTDAEIAELEQRRTIDPSTPIHSPLAGTIVQRKVGPGQYIGATSSEPVFIVGDMASVWLVAYVREPEAPQVQVGQAIEFTVLAHPGQVYRAKISHVAAGLDPGTRRLLVRATVDNSHGAFKPEMFASARIVTSELEAVVVVPLEAIIQEGSTARVWVARDGKTAELRRVKPGLISGNMVEIVGGLAPGETVILNGRTVERWAMGT